MIEFSEIKQLAPLVHLRLTPSEVERLSKDGAQILDYVDRLKELSVDNISIEDDRPRVKLREDRPVRFDRVGELIAAFPRKEGRFLKVPFVFEEQNG
ncbi:MAG TPA: Asp-tRNA(Asn)/Glu-tRNA(Gln) amidotransferase subunit GatC [Candidatus Pacearchaeota archaeon]|nr:Asp-tRNA(Asn)/Glu-tRNA(Gln) amidotransferase subunit GatC [Candidatus Pacearchaeota archaeon]